MVVEEVEDYPIGVELPAGDADQRFGHILFAARPGMASVLDDVFDDIAFAFVRPDLISNDRRAVTFGQSGKFGGFRDRVTAVGFYPVPWHSLLGRGADSPTSIGPEADRAAFIRDNRVVGAEEKNYRHRMRWRSFLVKVQSYRCRNRGDGR